MWNKINKELFNPYISWENNNKNGVNLPEEFRPVLIHNLDTATYYVGRFFCKNNEIHVMNDEKNYDTTLIKYLRWQKFDYYE